MNSMDSDVNGRLRDLIRRETVGWSDAQRAALLHRLNREATRRRVEHLYPTAGALAQALDHTTVQTPALAVIDEQVEWALNTRDARLAISVPPQEGKTTRVGVWGVLRALVKDPDRRCVIASYSDHLARGTARQARNIIREYGSGATDPLTGAPLPDRLGLGLADDKSAAANWRVAGHRGGLYAVGVGGSLTGQAAELLIIDDPLKGMTEADSELVRSAVITWWESVAQTRLAPGAPVIVIQTRWHEDDLLGHLLKQDRGRAQPMWRVVNLPAVATPGVPDALGREPGVPLVSARGRTAADFARIREDVGERVWAALYLGAPTPATGGLFSQVHFDRHRAAEVAGQVAARLVSVDPAETGRGDEAGVVALTVTADARVWVTDDASGRMTSDQWARRAVLLALQTMATEVVFEAFATGPTYERVLADAWRRVRREGRLLAAHGGDVAAAAVAYAQQDDAPGDALAALREVDGLRVPDQEDAPYLVRPWRAPGDKVARAAGTRQAAATGRLRMVGTHSALEGQATQWQQGQASPDRMDALVQGYERAMQLVGGQAQIAVPGQAPGGVVPGGGASFWNSRIG